jgi:GWxTD domain-containing protein
VEIFNDQDVSVAREIRPIALNRTSLPSATQQPGDIEGAITFILSDGTFKIVFEVDDLESGRSFVDKNQTVKARKVSRKSFDLSIPLFANVDTSHHDVLCYAPFNRGSDVLFGHARGGLLSQVYCARCDSVLKVHWDLRGAPESHPDDIQKFEGTQYELTSGMLSLVAKEGPVLFDVQRSDSVWKTLYIPLPLERLEPGQYKVDLTATDGKEHFKHELAFKIAWPNRPLSLMDWDIASDALRYIAKPTEMEKILGSSSDEGSKAFRDFWRQRDPDTTTAYNEMMVEYYHRVDEAIRQYSTVKERDGYKTDRGRIFILFGPPTEVDRSLLPGQPVREIWTYQNLRKRFVFTEKNKSGNFILTETTNL